jgi:predicted RNA-binding protein
MMNPIILAKKIKNSLNGLRRGLLRGLFREESEREEFKRKFEQYCQKFRSSTVLDENLYPIKPKHTPQLEGKVLGEGAFGSVVQDLEFKRKFEQYCQKFRSSTVLDDNLYPIKPKHTPQLEGKVLGEGAFGSVVLCQYQDGRQYARKVQYREDQWSNEGKILI